MMRGHMVQFAPSRVAADAVRYTAETFEMIDGGHRVLRVPCSPMPHKGGVHPVTAALRADPARPALDRVAIYAAFHAFGWTPAMYDYAMERAGAALADGRTPVDADGDAVRAARLAFDVPRSCAACAHWDRQGTAKFGACVRTDRATKAEQSCAVYARRLRVDEVVPDAHGVPVPNQSPERAA